MDQIDSMERRFRRAELLGEINAAWSELNGALDRLTPEQMTSARDRAGWTVKDHIAHMAAWERSVAAYMQGKPRYEGLGITQKMYYGGDDDEINAAIQKSRRGMSLQDVLTEFRDGHGELVGMVGMMSDADLNKANSDFQPEGLEARDMDERPISGMIFSNTTNHFREHLGWIESLVKKK
ncbi:MAG: ClbS/DfsB family four-helix bundle protein [Chloroflexia bacterium]